MGPESRAKGSISRYVLMSDKKNFFSGAERINLFFVFVFLFAFCSEYQKDLSENLWAILTLKEFNLPSYPEQICAHLTYHLSKVD